MRRSQRTRSSIAVRGYSAPGSGSAQAGDSALGPRLWPVRSPGSPGSRDARTQGGGNTRAIAPTEDAASRFAGPPGVAQVAVSALGLRPVHILVLTDRDWTHPQGGGTGTNLYGQVSRWLAWGHRVS